MSVIRGAAVVPATASIRATSGGRPSGGRIVRTVFYAVGIAAGLTYVAGRLRKRGAPGDAGSDRLSLIEDRLAQLDTTRLDQPMKAVPDMATAEAWIAQEAHERRLASLERRLTSIERVRDARRSLIFAKPNGNGNGNGKGTSHQDRRHG
jgi:hypothetical protein